MGLIVAVACLSILGGCGGEDSAKPAPIDKSIDKKAQDYMGNYRQQMIEANKGKAKPKDAPRKSG
jgi:hypothetical protein